MLAALLCNLSQPAPPPAVPAPFFGGGPFWKRYGYDPRYYGQEEDISEALPQKVVEVIEAAVAKAVEAVRNEPDPEPIVLDAKRIYEQALRGIRGKVRKEVLEILKADRLERKRIDEMWEAEIKRRLHEQEEEEIACLMCL